MMSDWNSEQYLKFKAERTQPSIDLVNRITVKEPQRIIDIGCGPGNSTAQLKKRYPDAYVLGVDFSPNMIEKAKADYKDIDFMLFDASKDFNKLEGKFDIVFSNACIQWVPEHKKLLRDMMRVLNPGGVLAVQMPAQYEMPMHTIVSEVSTNEKWSSKLSVKREFYYLTEDEYFDILFDISSDFSMWKTIYHHRLPSQESIVEWYKSTGLKPYLEQLDDADKKEFEKDILSEVKRVYKAQKNGEVIFKFHRLFFLAKK
ncbi:MAG: methyltransferase domain-containing protein [Clostridium sp.]|nr:methyltransferase domain-containing protein [Clostridium sp.]